MRVTEARLREARALCDQADKKAVLACMTTFGATDFRDDLGKLSLPTPVLHGDSDATVPFGGSGGAPTRRCPAASCTSSRVDRTGGREPRRGVEPRAAGLPAEVTPTDHPPMHSEAVPAPGNGLVAL
ncbi:hypothetical protein L6E12_28475 [Actinokineospora sp. PR83]|uniref:alpha/beta fold hydrolase n=1 Tax=Actinokineospora sp. PR83 TaxID=2884908 RepID=UPI001F4535DF|nr:hypothetical protein [Actinokineospora sp. PR83]MCG8919717.1 hypothetical protein [Actinokineospora sp. PR83]